METGYTKRALKHDPNAPIGQPSPLHLDCECGARVDVNRTQPTYPCACGITYDGAGWIIRRP